MWKTQASEALPAEQPTQTNFTYKSTKNNNTDNNNTSEIAPMR